MNKKVSDNVKIELASFAKYKFDQQRQQAFLVLPERAVELNESAAMVIELCQSPVCLDEIVEQIISNSSNSDGNIEVSAGEAGVVSSDVKEFLDDFVSRGWLKFVE